MRPDRTPASPEWLGTQGRQVLELIRASGFDLTLTLRQLLEVSTSYPLSSPPKWCETGCALAGEDGDCTILSQITEAANAGRDVEAKEWDRLLVIQQRWDGMHEWVSGEPMHGILYDCPCYREKT